MKTKIFLFLFLLLPGFTLRAQTINQISYYNINGTIAVSSIPGYMFISSGDIIDISDPANPVLNSSYSFGYAASIIAEEDYAYYGTEMSCDFFIADVSNIDFPLHKGFIDFGSDIGHGVFGMAKTETVVYVAIGKSVCSIDISDKSNPLMLDTLFINNGSNSQSRDIVVDGDYAYVAHYYGLKVLDVSHPSDLLLVTSVGSGYTSIDQEGNTVFLGKNSGGFDVFDISDPMSPEPLFSKTNTGGTAWDIKYKDEYIYLASNGNGLTIYKLENNSATEMANYYSEGGGQSFGVAVQDSLIFLTELITGVAILQYDSLGTVGVSKTIHLDENFSLYPNPASNYIIIENQGLKNTKVDVKVINSNGKLIDNFNYNGNIHRLEVGDYPTGIYYCKVSVEGNYKQTIKFIVY